MPIEKKRILILCKTYPTPSATYSELSCVAGIDDKGNMIRLFPVPFRMIDDDGQFKKWQWISASVQKAPRDRRAESHTISVDTIVCDPNPLPTRRDWAARRPILGQIPTFYDFAMMEANRVAKGNTISLLRPANIVRLEITPVADPAWSTDELAKLDQQQKQAGLFDDAEKRSIRKLRKLPYDFHYVYECRTASGLVQYRHKIVDWEIGALYWRCKRDYGADWEQYLRQKIEVELPAKDLMLLMGTIHRFPDQWLIISLIYPPKVLETGQGELSI